MIQHILLDAQTQRIFVVSQQNYEDREILSIHSSLTSANQRAEEYERSDDLALKERGYYLIHEHELED